MEKKWKKKKKKEKKEIRKEKERRKKRRIGMNGEEGRRVEERGEKEKNKLLIETDK